ncbi:Casparian strip membrane protein 3 [Heracleum sosnowskyi]|uniref:CASP-like protein n=1 Tax=Heracleum sosnowskyi TaxID=360622 RepID=A0AAD8H9F2_9APIA|nr:Casparian strip membrane protein 3 [Heracleum sosnowskyi]
MVSQTETGGTSKISFPTAGNNRGMLILGIILRIAAIVSTIASAVYMTMSDEQLQLFTQVSIFSVEYEDFSTLRYFVVINSIVSAYFAFSIPLAMIHIARSTAKQSRAVLIIMDMVTLGVLTSAASAATAIMFLAHNGNSSANWNAICNQYTGFCNKASASLIGSFVAIVILMFLISMSTVALARM